MDDKERGIMTTTTVRIELVIHSVDGKEVYRKVSDTDIDFTGHLVDGGLMEDGIYSYWYKIQTASDEVKGEGYFAILRSGGCVFTKLLCLSDMTVIPHEATSQFSLIQCAVFAPELSP